MTNGFHVAARWLVSAVASARHFSRRQVAATNLPEIDAVMLCANASKLGNLKKLVDFWTSFVRILYLLFVQPV